MKSSFDSWLDRGVKLIGILGFFGAVFIAASGMLFLPPRVSALESQVDKNAQTVSSNEVRFTKIESDIKYIRESVSYLVQKVDSESRRHA